MKNLGFGMMRLPVKNGDFIQSRKNFSTLKTGNDFSFGFLPKVYVRTNILDDTG